MARTVMSGALFVALGVAAVVGTNTPASSSASRAPARNVATVPAGIGVDGTYVNQVVLNGKHMSLEQYGVLEARSAHTATPLQLVVDQSAVGRGYFLAFDSRQQARAYVDSISPGRSTAVDHVGAKLGPGSDAAAPVQLGGDRVSLSLCSIPNHSGRLYENVSCGGSYFSVLWNESVPSLNAYGWDNRAESLVLGDCIANITVWKADNYSGTSRLFHSPGPYTSLNYGGTQNFGNEISSYKTDKTGPC